jgi:hypothetical protein
MSIKEVWKDPAMLLERASKLKYVLPALAVASAGFKLHKNINKHIRNIKEDVSSTETFGTAIQHDYMKPMAKQMLAAAIVGNPKLMPAAIVTAMPGVLSRLNKRNEKNLNESFRQHFPEQSNDLEIKRKAVEDSRVGINTAIMTAAAVPSAVITIKNLKEFFGRPKIHFNSSNDPSGLGRAAANMNTKSDAMAYAVQAVAPIAVGLIARNISNRIHAHKQENLSKERVDLRAKLTS